MPHAMPLAALRPPFRRFAKALAQAAFHTFVALAGTANAQVSGEPEAFYSPGMESAVSAPRAGTRGLFVATLAALIAQGLGNGVGTALSQGIGGSITKWFGAEPGAGSASSASSSSGSAGLPDPVGPMGVSGTMSSMGSASPPARLTPTRAPVAGEPSPAAGLQAGVAYEVHLIGPDLAVRPVDPARHVFHTGDRFQVHYRPSLPGRVRVFNLNPRGTESRIDSVKVAAGQLVSLGPYRFVGAQGDETLKLVLQPCSTPEMATATRSIVKVSALSGAAKPALRVGDCGAADTHARVRSIGKATMDGATAFALDPLTNREARSGQIAPRELSISLRHRP